MTMLKKNNPLLLLGALALCSLFAAPTRAWQTPTTPQISSTQLQPASATSTMAEVKEEPRASSDESYRIGPGDVLNIVVSKQTDYSREGVRVDNNGMIQIPRDDREVRAACKTPREVATEIKDRYKRYLRNPYVYVEIKEFQSQPVAVIGAVNTAGRFQLQRRVRLLELLTLANGPSEHAGSTVQIIRAADGAMCDSPSAGETANTGELLAYNLKNTLAGNEDSNPYVRQGDIVRLPEAEQAFIVGAIKTPAPIQLKETITLTEAIARSGGLLPEANGEKIRITRHVNGASTKTELTANLNEIHRRKQEDIVIQPNDIIDVPGASGTKKFLGELMKTIVPRITSYPLGVIR